MTDVQSELQERHSKTAKLVLILLAVTVLLSVISYLGKSYFRVEQDPVLDISVRITILIFGLGSVVLRRTKFSALRLQDIGALAGPSGLLKTLQNTTIQIALLGFVIAVIGFIATVITSNDFYSYGAGIVAIVVLLYCYPTRVSWERTVRKFAPYEEQGTGAESPSQVV